MRSLNHWAKIYGGIYRIKLPFSDTLVASDCPSIRHFLIENGNAFAGRVSLKRVEFMDLECSVANLQPGAAWRHVRKLSHRYMKQFGDGMSRLEEILLRNADYMLEAFDSRVGEPIDTLSTLKDTSLRSISVLLLGRALDPEHHLYDMLMRYERDVTSAANMSIGKLLIDICPWFVYMPLQASKDIWRFKKFQDECWQEVKAMQSQSEAGSLTQVLLESVTTNIGSGKDFGVTEAHAKTSSLLLITAGVGTTSRALHYILNALAFKQDIQDNVYSEVARITIAHRSRMPYLRATILECLRVFTVTPTGGVPHSAVADAVYPGHGVIPKGTVILINAWTLHHDGTFWDDPDVIRPERFLDDDGQLVPPDHPNRKHLLPFGAGPRVCLGEVFAMTRIFLWIAAVIQKFEIRVSPESNYRWLDPNAHLNRFTFLEPLANEIIFSRRK